MKTYTTADFARWGSMGSKKRKHRKLTTAQAKAMNRAKKKKGKRLCDTAISAHGV